MRRFAGDLQSNRRAAPFVGVIFFGGGPVDGEKPTTDWIGQPSDEDIKLFLWFVLCNPASRPLCKGKHQTSPMRGNFCQYGLPTKGQRKFAIRVSDFSRRIDGCVSLLQITGETNDGACSRVARFLKDRLRKTRRGRPRKTKERPSVWDEIQVVRGHYNDYKNRGHRWTEKLPERDLEVEYWWGSFLRFKDWAKRIFERAERAAKKQSISIKTYIGVLEQCPDPILQLQAAVMKQMGRASGKFTTDDF